MKFNGKVIEEPYVCDPSNQANFCELYFDVDEADELFTLANPTTYTRSFVKNQCKCALDGDIKSGFCSSMLGTLKYERATAAMLIVKE